MCNRTGRRPVHEPVRTLANTFILFSRPTQGKTKCKQVSASKQDCKVMRPHKAQPHRPAALFFLFSRDPPSLGSRLSILLSSTRLQNRRFCVSQELRRGVHRPVFTPARNDKL